MPQKWFTKIWPIVETLANFNGKNCDVNRFECQKVNYAIDYILLITYND